VPQVGGLRLQEGLLVARLEPIQRVLVGHRAGGREGVGPGRVREGVPLQGEAIGEPGGVPVGLVPAGLDGQHLVVTYPKKMVIT
jgi:hypothetical protein